MQTIKKSISFNKEVRKKEVFLFKEDILNFDLPGNKQTIIKIKEA